MTDERRELLGAVVFPVPAGWTAQHQVVLQLPDTGAPDLAFQPNIVLRRQAVSPPGAGVEAVANDRAQLLAQHLPGFDREASSRDQLLGQRAVRMTYAWHNGSHRLRQVLVLCVLDGWLYELTFSDVPERFDQSVAAFDHWLAALAVRGGDPGDAGRLPAGLDVSALFRRP